MWMGLLSFMPDLTNSEPIQYLSVFCYVSTNLKEKKFDFRLSNGQKNSFNSFWKQELFKLFLVSFALKWIQVSLHSRCINFR